ncbi:MAG: sigma-54 dependent transcriptional regulator [Desulfohalobiaceae bacterium]|nr:sigma-54 dependent transcriptional regulator [Desulfohalobiaceae bacterium]
MTAQLLIVDDDASHLQMLSTLLGGWGYHIDTAEDGGLALEKIRASPYDLVLMDVRMAGVDGIEAMQGIKEHNPAIPVLIMTAYSSVDNAVEALKSGAYDYLTKPLDFDVLQHTLQRALDHVRLASENVTLRQRLPPGARDFPIIGKSRAMQDLMDMVATVAPTEATVLITGPSGTGKELVAKAIHAASERSEGPLVTVNCAALKDSLLESELFGHEKGAFTGAERRREGKFMQAHTGSIFLDEITEIPMAMQAKLLRVIQEREIERVGGDRTLYVDVRIIAATNRDLNRVVEEGAFREDLYHRLNVFRLDVPTLSEREGDIPVLAQHFLQEYADKNRKEIKGFTPQAMDLLVKYDWPGNVRELENVVERAVILSSGEYITPRELPLSLGQQDEDEEEETVVAGGRNLEEVEKEAIGSTLRQTGGNKSEAARILGITRATLHKKLKRYGIEEP